MTDDERVRRAELVAGRWEGPREAQPCSIHPNCREIWRWVWTLGTDIEDAEQECVEECHACADEQDLGSAIDEDGR